MTDGALPEGQSRDGFISRLKNHDWRHVYSVGTLIVAILVALLFNTFVLLALEVNGLPPIVCTTP